MDNKKTFLVFQIIFLITSCIVAIEFEQYMVLIIAIVPCIFIIRQHYHWKVYIVILILLMACILFILFIPKQWSLSNVADYFNTNIPNNLRDISIDYLNNNYQETTLSFLRLLLFNEKQYNDQTFILFKNLGILHLFVVSGLHVSILTGIFNKVFNKWPMIGKPIILVVCCILWYFSNFSISILRIILVIMMGLIKPIKHFSNFTKNCYAAIIISIIFTRDAASYSFILTFMCTLLINYICEKFNNKIIKYLLINLLIFFATIPIVIMLNKSFNVLAFINNFGFSWLIMALYIFELFFVWITPISEFNTLLIMGIINFFENLLYLQPILKTDINEYFIIFIYTIMFLIFNWKWDEEINTKEWTINYNSLYVKN